MRKRPSILRLTLEEWQRALIFCVAIILLASAFARGAIGPPPSQTVRVRRRPAAYGPGPAG